MISNASCPLCKSDTRKIFSAEEFSVLRCDSCVLGFLNPMPTKSFLKDFYNKDYFQNDSEISGYSDYGSMAQSLKKEANRKLQHMQAFLRKGDSILDIGSGTGYFALAAKNAGYNVEVLDVSSWAIKEARKLGLKGYVSDLSTTSLPRKQYRAISAWDVIEHFDDPEISLKSVRRILRKNGYLFMTTPSLSSIDAKLLGKRWYGFKKIPEHVYYFSPKSMRIVAERVGFNIVDTKDWGFVRDIGFIADKVALYNKQLGFVLKKTADSLGIGHANLYLPLTDMFVVLRK